jgi:ABC-type nitrate/sulfonate/bicarbonate transport system permease component
MSGSTMATPTRPRVNDVSQRTRRTVPPLVLRAIAGLVILALWQLLVAGFEPAYIARPIGVLKRIGPVFSDGQFLKDIAYTLSAVLEGLAIAAVLGLAIGLVMGRLPDVRRALGMYVNSFYAMPLIALVPLLTVWFGYTPRTRLVVVVIEAILPIIYNVSEGAASVSATYIEVARIHRSPWWRVWLGVVLPSSFPYLLAGIDLAIGRALIGAVVAEFIAAINGLGYFILFNVRSFHEDDAIVALLVLVAFAVGLRALVSVVVARGFRWYRPV